MKLSYRDQSNLVLSLMKTRQDNDMIDRIGAVYVENDSELWWLIRSSAIIDEN